MQIVVVVSATLLVVCRLVAGEQSGVRDGAASGDAAQLLLDAQAANSKGDFKTALPLFQKAIDVLDRSHDEPALAKALDGYAVSMWGSGDYSRAVETLDRSLSLVRKLNDQAGLATVLNDLGLCLYSMGRYDAALERYMQSLETLKASPSPRLEGSVRANIGLVYRYQGRLQEATEWFDASLRLRRDAGDVAGMGQSLNHLGMVSRARGQFNRSVEYYTQSLTLRRQAGDRQGEAQTLNNLANALSDLGETEAAIESYTKALQISEAIGYRVQIANSHANISGLLEDAGRFTEALARAEQALAVYRDMSQRSRTADTLRRVGRLQMVLGSHAAAHDALNEALALSRAIKEPEGEALVLETLGKLAFAEGDRSSAIARQDEALAIARATGAPNIEWEVLADRGRALRAVGKVDGAIADFRAATAIINDLRANVSTDTGRIGLFDTRREVFYWLADALASSGRVGEALEVAEASRARAFADLLAQRSTIVKAADVPALEQVRDAVAQLSANASASAPIPGTRGGALDAALKSMSSELASLVTVAAPALEEIQKQAHALDATIVEYMVGGEHTLVWVISPDGAVHEASIETALPRFEEKVRTLRRTLEPDGDTLQHPERAQAMLRDLGALAIDPIAAWLPSDPERVVIVIPDGPLAYVPFAALTDREGAPLIARHVLAFAPSVSVFRYTAQKRQPAGRINALVVADPVPPSGSNLTAIPGSRREAEQVIRRIGASRAQLLEGPNATESAVKRLSRDRTILHFATHGLVSSDRPLATSLVFASGEGEDGYLRVSEVFGLDLRANLVVLSGCSTGLGRLSSDGFIGLTRAFVYAGTPTVVVSQWDVSDRATTILMDRFYAELARGRSTAQALRSASLATRRQFPHPALWAAFQVVGEPR